jgi:hypothetical protein
MISTQMARAAVQGFSAFEECRLHERFDDRDVFVFEMPKGVQVYGVVMGGAGMTFGLSLWSGPEAALALDAMLRGAAAEFFEWEATMLSVLREEADEMSPEYAEIAREGGAIGEVWPLFMVQAPDEQPRAPDAAELEILARALHAMRRAEQRGLLAEKGDIAGHLMPRLKVSGTVTSPKVRVDLVSSMAQELLAPSPIAVPKSLAKLPRRKGERVIALPRMSQRIHGEDVALRAVMVLDARNRFVELMDVVQGRDYGEAAARIFAILANGGPSEDQLAAGARAGDEDGAGEVHGLRGAEPGLPERMLFVSRGLHACLSAGFEEIGVECRYAENCEPLEEMLGEFDEAMSQLGDPEPGELPPDPEDEESWQALDVKYVDLLQSDLMKDVEDPQGALEEFGLLPPEEIDEADHGACLSSALDWVALHYRPHSGAPSYVEKLIGQELEPGLRALLNEMQRSYVSLFRYEGAEGERSLLCDLWSGERLRALSSLEDRSYAPGQCMMLRMFRTGDEWRFRRMSPIFPPQETWAGLCAFEALHWAARERRALPGEEVRFGEIWLMMGADGRPRSLDSDTEESDSYSYWSAWRVSERAGMRRFFAHRRDLDPLDENASWVWMDEMTLPGPGSMRNLELQLPDMRGELELRGDLLYARCSAEEDALELREQLDAVPGLERLAMPSMLPDFETGARDFWQGAGLGKKRATKEAYLALLEQPVPGLGGRTPLEAAKDPAMHELLRWWVRCYPPQGRSRVAVPRAEMLERLGLGS